MPSAPRDKNAWHGVGLVHQPIKRGVTRSGEEVCSFQMLLRDETDRATWVRVNVYPVELVEYVLANLYPGSRVEVSGGLMNRKRGKKSAPQLTEVRATGIELLAKENKK
jgi:hypothetical protein